MTCPIHRIVLLFALRLAALIALLPTALIAQQDVGGFTVVNVAADMGDVDIHLRIDQGTAEWRSISNLRYGSSSGGATINAGNYRMRITRAGDSVTIAVTTIFVWPHQGNTYFLYQRNAITRVDLSSTNTCATPAEACVYGIGSSPMPLTIVDAAGAEATLPAFNEATAGEGIAVRVGLVQLGSPSGPYARIRTGARAVIILNGDAWIWVPWEEGPMVPFKEYSSEEVSPGIRILNVDGGPLGDVEIDAAIAFGEIPNASMTRTLPLERGAHRVRVMASGIIGGKDRATLSLGGIDTTVELLAGELTTLVTARDASGALGLGVVHAKRTMVPAEGSRLDAIALTRDTSPRTLYVKGIVPGGGTPISTWRRSARLSSTTFMPPARSVSTVDVDADNSEPHRLSFAIPSGSATIVFDGRTGDGTWFLLDNTRTDAQPIAPLTPVADADVRDRIRALSLMRDTSRVAVMLDGAGLGEPLEFGRISPTARWSEVSYHAIGTVGSTIVHESTNTVLNDYQHTILFSVAADGRPHGVLIADELDAMVVSGDSARVRVLNAVDDGTRPYYARIGAHLTPDGVRLEPFWRTNYVTVPAAVPITITALSKSGSIVADSVVIRPAPGTVSTVLFMPDVAGGAFDFYLLDDSTGPGPSRILDLRTSGVASSGSTESVGEVVWRNDALHVVRTTMPDDIRLSVVNLLGRIALTAEGATLRTEVLASGLYTAVATRGGAVVARGRFVVVR